MTSKEYGEVVGNEICELVKINNEMFEALMKLKFDKNEKSTIQEAIDYGLNRTST